MSFVVTKRIFKSSLSLEARMLVKFFVMCSLIHARTADPSFSGAFFRN